MSKGFSFNHGKCVNCGACSAACILYNEWDTKPRNVYSFNEQLLHDLPIVNISLACNHCTKAACLEGCPAGAFSRNETTGAVILDEERCLGCRYCQWNCPYDAPKFSKRKKIIEKCHLCNNSGDSPSCTSACPTGALSFREISPGQDLNAPEWFHQGNLIPALEFTGNPKPGPLKIIPVRRFTECVPEQSEAKISAEWSLIAFSFMAMVAVSISFASFLNGVFPGILFFAIILSAAFISLFHLGRPLRALRVLTNPARSPLSREIISFLIFCSLLVVGVILRSPGFLLAGSISGLIFLIAIDTVYFMPDKNIMYHSGQTFLSSLLLISYLTDNLLPFTFIAIIKVLLSILKFKEKNYEGFRFIRIALLVLAWAGLVSGYAVKSNPLTLMILSAELIDRYLFYHDFRPENIRYLIEKNIKSQYDEKKRG